ncbi:hypothetical protein [Kocuria sp. CH-021]|uniref:hypothetical protein n=1 Tax=Kocuria sp. CH-021 TaxID=3406735 RepID=UPI003C75215D
MLAGADAAQREGRCLTLLHGAGNVAGDVFFGDDATLWEAFPSVDTVVMTVLAAVLVLVLGTGLSSRTSPRADPQEARLPGHDGLPRHGGGNGSGWWR